MYKFYSYGYFIGFVLIVLYIILSVSSGYTDTSLGTVLMGFLLLLTVSYPVALIVDQIRKKKISLDNPKKFMKLSEVVSKLHINKVNGVLITIIIILMLSVIYLLGWPLEQKCSKQCSTIVSAYSDYNNGEIKRGLDDLKNKVLSLESEVQQIRVDAAKEKFLDNNPRTFETSGSYGVYTFSNCCATPGDGNYVILGYDLYINMYDGLSDDLGTTILMSFMPDEQIKSFSVVERDVLYNKYPILLVSVETNYRNVTTVLYPVTDEDFNYTYYRFAYDPRKDWASYFVEDIEETSEDITFFIRTGSKSALINQSGKNEKYLLNLTDNRYNSVLVEE